MTDRYFHVTASERVIGGEKRRQVIVQDHRVSAPLVLTDDEADALLAVLIAATSGDRLTKKLHETARMVGVPVYAWAGDMLRTYHPPTSGAS